MAIDWTKPIQTRDGLKARVLTTEREDKMGGRRICALVSVREGLEEVWFFYPDGSHSLREELSPYDITNVPEKKVGYLNVYKGHCSSLLAPSRRDADGAAATHRVGCIRIEYTEGQFDD